MPTRGCANCGRLWSSPIRRRFGERCPECEAGATGKPVHVLGLDGSDGKFARFHETMRQAGITRPFAGRIESWSYAPLDDTKVTEQ